MSKLDKNHPVLQWLKAMDRSVEWLGNQLGYGSPATVYRWIRGERHPSPVDQEQIAELSKQANGEPAVPVSIWHELKMRKVRAAVAEVSAALAQERQ